MIYCTDVRAFSQRPYDLRVALNFEQSKLYMDGFRSLKEGEPVEFTFKKSSKGLESLRVTGPGGVPCAGSEKKPKGAQKRRSKGDRYVLVACCLVISPLKMVKMVLLWLVR